eukprot:TRINITY_DN11739_c0_g1_i2.p1 TRINITY_DN11739_c0_g1~~TRINITY_DN11739_c0_g1_i2.p1  ORF type:complete len:377 (+),score=86.12 TRINITY_DN11739_c0_g1_i2:62-1192(+)
MAPGGPNLGALYIMAWTQAQQFAQRMRGTVTEHHQQMYYRRESTSEQGGGMCWMTCPKPVPAPVHSPAPLPAPAAAEQWDTSESGGERAEQYRQSHRFRHRPDAQDLLEELRGLKAHYAQLRLTLEEKKRKKLSGRCNCHKQEKYGEREQDSPTSPRAEGWTDPCMKQVDEEGEHGAEGVDEADGEKRNCAAFLLSRIRKLPRDAFAVIEWVRDCYLFYMPQEADGAEPLRGADGAEPQNSPEHRSYRNEHFGATAEDSSDAQAVPVSEQALTVNQDAGPPAAAAAPDAAAAAAAPAAPAAAAPAPVPPDNICKRAGGFCSVWATVARLFLMAIGLAMAFVAGVQHERRRQHAAQRTVLPDAEFVTPPGSPSAAGL